MLPHEDDRDGNACRSASDKHAESFYVGGESERGIDRRMIFDAATDDFIRRP
jgi:hypothetical protein